MAGPGILQPRLSSAAVRPGSFAPCGRPETGAASCSWRRSPRPAASFCSPARANATLPRPTTSGLSSPIMATTARFSSWPSELRESGPDRVLRGARPGPGRRARRQGLPPLTEGVRRSRRFGGRLCRGQGQDPKRRARFGNFPRGRNFHIRTELTTVRRSGWSSLRAGSPTPAPAPTATAIAGPEPRPPPSSPAGPGAVQIRDYPFSDLAGISFPDRTVSILRRAEGPAACRGPSVHSQRPLGAGHPRLFPVHPGGRHARDRVSSGLSPEAAEEALLARSPPPANAMSRPLTSVDLPERFVKKPTDRGRPGRRPDGSPSGQAGPRGAPQAPDCLAASGQQARRCARSHGHPGRGRPRRSQPKDHGVAARAGPVLHRRGARYRWRHRRL